MNILFIASTDSYNTELLPLARAAQQRGHHVHILLTHAEEAHNRMLLDKAIPRSNWRDFEAYDAYDIFIYGNILNQDVSRKVRAQNGLKIGLFFHLVIDDFVLGGENLHADFTLCYGPRLVKTQKSNGIVHNLVPVGPPFSANTKYSQEANSQSDPHKKLLFLEQHFYPSGDRGKQQLADFLCELARARPDYTITVKPRALETEKDPRHKARHIYSYIREQPNNLVLLREHRDLEEEIDKASIVATTFSTAVTAAILKDKPVIFVNGFAMKETQFYNRAMVKRYYKLYEDSGNLVHFNKVLARLDTFTAVHPELKHSLFLDRKQDFNKAVLDFIEYAVNFKGYAVNDCNIENYRSTLNKKQRVDVRDRINNQELERFYLLNVVSGFRLETQRKQLLAQLIELKQRLLDEENHAIQASEICERVCEESIDFLLKHYRQHPVGFKGYYLKQLFKNQDEAACDALPSNWRIADYYYNKYLFNSNNKPQAKYYLGKYLDIAKSEDYRLTHLYENTVIRQTEELYAREFG